MKLRLTILLFWLTIFGLTTLGMIAFYTRELALAFWLTFVVIIAYPCTFAIFVPLLTGDGRLSAKKILLLTSSITILAIAVVNVAWVIVTPKWSFSVATDRSSYKMGEDVKIAVSLRNVGYITHSFKSSISNPVVVTIEYQHTENPTSRIQVWYSPFGREVTEFSVGSNFSLERQFIWNQTLTVNQWFSEEIKPGIYWIQAYIPHAASFTISSSPIFYAAETITIAST